MFTVRWKRAARDQLTNIWLNSSERNAITSDIHSIEQALANNPQSLGESRSGSRRVCISKHLVIHFEVLAKQNRVTVLAVRAVKH
jgi:plasmid stabilization system protein ParE